MFYISVEFFKHLVTMFVGIIVVGTIIYGIYQTFFKDHK